MRAILLDRDGVLNRKATVSRYIRWWSEFEWIPGAKETLVHLKKKGFVLIVLTNQAGVARGMVRREDLEEIHENMKKELTKEGGGLDAVYVCPHGYGDGCDCRKPKPGLLLEAQKDFNLRMAGSKSRIERAKIATSFGPGLSLKFLYPPSNRPILLSEIWLKFFIDLAQRFIFPTFND